MTKVVFIEVTASRTELSACQIAERTYLEGGKLQIITSNQQQAVRLDDLLWTFRPDSFVPHGFFGGEENEPLPPVIITIQQEKIPDFESLLMLDYCPVETVAQFSQAIHFVIVDNQERLAASRDYWIQLKEAGFKLRHQKRYPG